MKASTLKKVEDLLNWIKSETGVSLVTVNEIENNEIENNKIIEVYTEPTRGFEKYLALLKLEKKLDNLIEFYRLDNDNKIKIVLNF